MLIKISKFFLTLFIISAILLPSGSVFNINIKIILTLILYFLVIVLTFLKSKLKLIELTSILGFGLFIMFFSFISIINQIPLNSILSESIALSSMFSTIYLPLYFISKRVVKREYVIKTILISLVSHATFKLLIEILLLTGQSFDDIKNLFYLVFGVSFIGLDAKILYRIHFPTDYLIPTIIYFLMMQKEFGYKISKKYSLIYIILLIVSGVISYSRYLWMFIAASILLSLTFNKNKLFKTSLYLFAIVTVIIITITGNPLISFIKDRYYGDFSISSDTTRVEMFTALVNTINYHPIFGRGLGADAYNYTNIESIPWYFELQWLGFFMQFGVVGFSILIILAISVFFLILKNPIIKSALGLSILYFLWLFLGLFNGFMITSVGGIIFLTYIILGQQINFLVNQKRLHFPTVESSSIKLAND